MTASKKWARFAWAATLAGGLTLAFGLAMNWTRAQDTPVQPKARAAAPAKPADPKAKALLAEVAKAYKGLNSYTDEGQFVMAMTVAGKPQKQTLPLKLTFVRPNKMDFDAGPVRLVSDGKTMTTTVIPLKRYTSEPAPGEINFETFRQGPTGAVLFGGPSGASMFVLLNLLTAPDAAAALGQLGGSLQLAPEDPKAAAAGSPGAPHRSAGGTGHPPGRSILPPSCCPGSSSRSIPRLSPRVLQPGSRSPSSSSAGPRVPSTPRSPRTGPSPTKFPRDSPRSIRCWNGRAVARSRSSR